MTGKYPESIGKWVLDQFELLDGNRYSEKELNLDECPLSEEFHSYWMQRLNDDEEVLKTMQHNLCADDETVAIQGKLFDSVYKGIRFHF